MRARFPRHRLLPLVGLSGLLHAGLLAWLAREDPRAERPEPHRPPPLVVELEFHDAPPSSQAVPPPAPRRPQKKVPRTSPRPEQAAPPAPVPAASGTAREDAPPTEKPPPEDAPHQTQLLPSGWALAPGPELPAGKPPSSGRTLHPGDPELQPESREQERARVTARVQGWLDEDAAEARAEGIGQHPYFGQWRGSLQGVLSHAKGGTPEDLGVTNPVAGLMKNYAEAVQEYGRTGSPGGTPPPAPLQSERLGALFRDDPATGMRLMAQAQGRETLEALNRRSALLTVKIEIRQSREGTLLGARLEESSGNRLFDAFVLKAVPASLDSLAPPPAVVLRDKPDLRTEWLVEGWHHVSPEMESTVSSLMTGTLPVPTGLLTGGKIEPARFDYRARLLKVY